MIRKLVRALVIASGFVAVAATTPALYARDSQGSHNSLMERGVSNAGGMKGGNSMKGMMGQMNAMMENCSKLMQEMMNEDTRPAPNEQWRNSQPDQRKKQG